MGRMRERSVDSVRRSWRVLRDVLGTHRHRFRSLAASDRAYTLLILRMAIAATISYVLSLALLDPTGRDITAPMTTVLVMQASLFATLTSGLRRVAAVFAGAVIGALVALVVPLEWWSLAVVIPLAMLAGFVLDLREHLGETSVTALLVFATTSPVTTGETRMLLSLIGAVVGMAFMYLVPQRAPRGLAAEKVEGAADRMATILHDLARDLEDGVGEEPRGVVVSRLSDFQELDGEIAAADRAITQESETKRLTAASLASDDTFPLLHAGVEAIRVCNRHVIGHLQGVLEELDENPTREGRRDISVIADTFAALGRSLAALGDLLGEAGTGRQLGAERWGELETALAEANSGLRRQRERHRRLSTDTHDADAVFVAFAGSLALTLASAIHELDENRWHELWTSGRSRFGDKVRTMRGRLRRDRTG